MAETADILANRPEQLASRGGQRVTVVLPDLAAGCSMADMADIDQVEDCWEQLGEVIDIERRDAGHLRQLGGQPEGVLRPARRHRLHVGQRPGRAGLGVPAAAAACCSSPISTWAATRPGRWAFRWSEMPRLGPAPGASWAATRREAIRGSRVLLWKGHCSVHQMFLPQHVAPVPREVSGHQDPRPSRVHDGSGRSGRRGRLDRQDHPGRRARPRRARNGPSAPSCTWSTG